MKYLIVLILMFNMLPAFSRFDDPECDRLMQLALNERNITRQTYLISDAYSACYRNQPYSPSISEGLQQSQQTVQQSQINNIQTQQNYTNWLLLQHNLNNR